MTERGGSQNIVTLNPDYVGQTWWKLKPRHDKQLLFLERSLKIVIFLKIFKWGGGWMVEQ